MSDKKLPVDEFLETVTKVEREIGWRLDFCGDDVMHGARPLVDDDDRDVPVVYKTVELGLDAAVAAAKEHAHCKKGPTTQGGYDIPGNIEDGAGGVTNARTGPPGATLEFRQRELVEFRKRPDSESRLYIGGVDILWDVRIVQNTQETKTVEVEGETYTRQFKGKNILRDWFPMRHAGKPGGRVSNGLSLRVREEKPKLGTDVRTLIRFWVEPVKVKFVCREDPAEQESRRC